MANLFSLTNGKSWLAGYLTFVLQWFRGYLLPLLGIILPGFRREQVEHDEKNRLLAEDETESAPIDYAATWPNDLGFDTIREERASVALKVSGTIPLYAAGTIYRNGPGAYQLKDLNTGAIKYTCSHWFDGFAQLHKFELIPGDLGISEIRYSSRFSVDSLMEELRATGSYTGYTFAQKRDPCVSMFRKVMSLFTPSPRLAATNCNVPVTVSASGVGFPASRLPEGHRTGKAAHLIAGTDEGRIKALDAETLEPVGLAHQSELHPLLKGPISASHAKSDPLTGDVFNYNLDLGPSAIYRVFRTSAATGETEILATISARDLAPAYMHSFFLSENFVILAVWSAHLMAGGLRVLWEKNVLDAIAPFDDSKVAKWFVVDRRHGRGVVAAFESPAAFCFHTVNTFEVPSREGGTGEVDLVCDLMEYDNLDVLHAFYYENLKASSPKAAEWIWEKRSGCNEHFARYRLPNVPLTKNLQGLSKSQRERKSSLPASRLAVREATIPKPIAGDMPTINPAYLTKPYRYLWNCTWDCSRTTFIDGLCKIDTHTGSGTRWDNPPGHSPGEAIFVPRPGGAEEDDGVLLTVVLDGFGKTSYLLCLDARTMRELGRADCQGVVPFTFHGQHVMDGQRPVNV